MQCVVCVGALRWIREVGERKMRVRSNVGMQTCPDTQRQAQHYRITSVKTVHVCFGPCVL